MKEGYNAILAIPYRFDDGSTYWLAHGVTLMRTRRTISEDLPA